MFDGRFTSRQQHAWPGSYALIEGAKDVTLPGALAVEALIWPTLPERRAADRDLAARSCDAVRASRWC